MNSNSTGGMTRRSFMETGKAWTAACASGGILSRAGAAQAPAAFPDDDQEPQQPFLTPADEFREVARGNPKPSTLTGDAVAEAGLTPETWRLEITADPVVDPPHVKAPATVSRQLLTADGTALDFPALLELNRRHGVRYIKAIQCLNIPRPLGQGLWEGVPLRSVLELCGGMSNVRRIYYRGFHNHDPAQIFQSSLSYSQVMETAPGEYPVFLACRLNGAPIPLERGGPVRMIVPWAHGFKSIKWLQQIFLTNDYRSNDTYSLSNNDPESILKTAAYVNPGPAQIAAGRPVVLTGQAISGPSGVERVEYWIRKVQAAASQESRNALDDDDPALLQGPWIPCELEEPPDWPSILPSGISPADLMGFDPQTAQPRSWPLKYGMAGYRAAIRDLAPGHYEIRARAVDRNGFAQPEPRPQQKSGMNSIQVRRVEVI